MFATTLSNVAATVTENGLPLSYNCWTVEEEGSEYLGIVELVLLDIF